MCQGEGSRFAKLLTWPHCGTVPVGVAVGAEVEEVDVELVGPEGGFVVDVGVIGVTVAVGGPFEQGDPLNRMFFTS